MTWTALPDSQCQTGESPFWHPLEQSLYWLDIPGRAVLRTRGDVHATPQIERWPLPQEPGCMAPARTGGLVIALRDGIYRARQWGAPLQPLTGVDYDTASMRFNDGKADARGRFWASTINEAKDRPNATLYCLDARSGADGAAWSLRPMAGGGTNGNGLAFGADGATLYWADTTSHRVRSWAWDMAANQLGAERVWHQFDTQAIAAEKGQPYGGRPDGACSDAQGRYWVALYEGARLVQLDAEGRLVQALPLPVQCPTMPCFGGEDLRTLFVTSAAKGRSEEERARLPLSGQVLWQRMPVAGQPVHFFDD